ncbi:DUF3021 domain-containing protein [Enterococcus gilvus]|uniref:DUF3021 domain-containing protein n=1 Tax=Enterococcus gilvus TaxID=160453 RepID=UPI0029100D39|nr:DUF3021 domain-containing protein [Enterococcus gilvus]MDU5510296.1 DUF3021 domain-containing protein [Enterococcus gilvus]
MKELLKVLGRSIGIGSTICMVFAVLFSTNEVRRTVASFLILSVVIGLLGLVYQMKKGSLLLHTLIHIGGSFLAFLIVAKINHWFPFKWQIIFSASLSFFVVFFGIWMFYYLKYKQEIEKINQKL